MQKAIKLTATSPAWLAYVAPMAGFIAITIAEGYASPLGYVWLYALKVIVVTILLYIFRDSWKDIKPRARVIVPAVGVGLIVFAEWVLLDKWIRYPHLSVRVAFNPFSAIDSTYLRGLFLACRFYGLVIMVPLMEELFWRSFALRYLTDADFTKIPVGAFSWTAFAMVAVAFGISHPEWLVAIIAACAYALLLRWTQSLFACVVAHSVTNLALGIYVIAAEDWMYW